MNIPTLFSMIKCNNVEDYAITSDPHLNHEKVSKWKGYTYDFDNVDDYNDFILNSYIEASTKFKYLIILGDLAFGLDADKWIDKLAELPFEQVYVMPGNHMAGMGSIFKINPKTGMMNLTYKKLHLILPGTVIKCPNDRRIQLTHFPIEVREWGCLCGHLHGKSTNHNATPSSYYGRIFDCGVVNSHAKFGRAYFSLTECISILEDKEYVHKDMIHENYERDCSALYIGTQKSIERGLRALQKRLDNPEIIYTALLKDEYGNIITNYEGIDFDLSKENIESIHYDIPGLWTINLQNKQKYLIWSVDIKYLTSIHKQS